MKARSRPTDTTLQRHVSFFDDDGDLESWTSGAGSSSGALKTLAGYVAATAEWQLLLALGADTVAVEGGKTVPALSAARMKSFYDGTLFYRLAKEHARRARSVR